MTSNSAPRPIKGSIGSRIRLIFGESGSEWLLLLNEDDGNREFQTPDWNNIPNAVAKQINNCTNKGRYIKEIDLGPCGMWYMEGIKRDQTGNHAWWNTSAANVDISDYYGKSDFRASFGSDGDGMGYYKENARYVLLYGSNGYCANCNSNLLSRIQRINKRSKKIHFVRLFYDDAYFISDSEGTQWCGVGEHCAKELKKNNAKVEEVAVAKDGSWVVIFPNHFSSSNGVDKRLTKALTDFYARQRARNQRRAQEITNYHEQVAARERAEREAAAERARLEQAEREAAAERARLEQAEREAAAERERLERERMEQEAARAAEEERLRQEQESSYRAQAEREIIARQEMEARLENHILEEAQSILDLESLLKSRKRSVQEMIVTMPPERRARVQEFLSDAAGDTFSLAAKATVAECVVCQNANAERAIVPCGHHCLCDDCSESLVSPQNGANGVCPLCRVPIERTLKIFSPH